MEPVNENELSDLVDKLDPEAHLLCALLWQRGTSPAVEYLAAELCADDFENKMYAKLFALICDQVAQAKPFDPPSIAARLHAAGDGASRSYQAMLLSITGLGAPASNCLYYADQVLSTWYRRQYIAAITSLDEGARTVGESELFPLFLEHGYAQRRAHKRRAGFLANAPAEQR